jgi:hypothetical protein
MSWVEKFSEGLKVVTGDGRTYEPLIMLDSYVTSYDFNISEFTFPEVSGTRVERRLPKGRRFPVEFYFQGTDHLDISEQFRISANNVKPWTVTHPAFGRIICHPSSMEIDSRGMNVTKITTTLLETIPNDGPVTIQDLQSSGIRSVSQAIELDQEMMSPLQPTVTDVVVMQDSIETMYEQAVTYVNDDQTFSDYINIYGKATNAINNALNDFSTGILFINNFINYPFNFVIGVKQRLLIYKDQIDTLIQKLDNFNDKNKKTIFESQAGSLVTGAIQSVFTPLDGDYKNAVDVLNVTDSLLAIYNEYLQAVQDLQSSDATQTTSYNPNSNYQYQLNYSVNFAVANLLQIAIGAQQERIIYLESDSNVIVQAHRFYGITQDETEDTIQYFIDTNIIQMRELIGLKKGRKLVYYV